MRGAFVRFERILEADADGAPIRTAGNPIKLNAYEDIDPDAPMRSPALNRDREKILAELMRGAGAYAPTQAGDPPLKAGAPAPVKKEIQAAQ